LLLRKISKFDAARCQILRLKCAKCDFRWEASQTPQLYLRGPTSKEREENEGRGRGKRKEEEEREEKRKGKGGNGPTPSPDIFLLRTAPIGLYWILGRGQFFLVL